MVKNSYALIVMRQAHRLGFGLTAIKFLSISVERLTKEIAQAPDFLIEEVLNFLLFIKSRLRQRVDENQSLESSQNLSSLGYLDFVDEISQQIPPEEWEKLPSDLSVNLDHYLYGSPIL
jgi:hypothetical protein